MRRFSGSVPKGILSSFVSNIGAGEFFTQAGNLVSVEQAIAVLGVLSPDFVEREGHVFWIPNAQDYVAENFPLIGLRTEAGKLQKSTSLSDVERYRNNLSVSQFFSAWEDVPDRPVFKVGLSKEDYEMCHVFADELARYWRGALAKHFPDRSFEFEVGDDLLDEFGVCLTFCQVLDHSAAGSSGST